jgi:hypothetical protein
VFGGLFGFHLRDHFCLLLGLIEVENEIQYLVVGLVQAFALRKLSKLLLTRILVRPFGEIISLEGRQISGLRDSSANMLFLEALF